MGCISTYIYTHKVLTRWYNVAFLWEKLRVNRKYKDRLFRFPFRDKEDLLDALTTKIQIKLSKGKSVEVIVEEMEESVEVVTALIQELAGRDKKM